MGQPTRDPLWELIIEKTNGNFYRASPKENPKEYPYFYDLKEARLAAKEYVKETDVKRIYIVERKVIEEYNGPNGRENPKSVPLDDRL